MSFRTVLAVAGLTQGENEVRNAVALCEETNAHLSVLVVAMAAPPPIGEYAAIVSDAWLQERETDIKALKRRVADVSRYLFKTGISADLSSEYPEVAWADETIGRRGRYADITVILPELPVDDTVRKKAIQGALFSSGKPLLLVPEGWQATFKPRRVMIAWDSRLEASRAVRESLDMLKAADEVRLVLVDPVEGEEGHGAEPGADVAVHLARHGVKVTVDRLPGQGRAVADILRMHAVDCAADLMVMGAYGHSRMREFIFGGVTRTMIEEPPLPILMAR